MLTNTALKLLRRLLGASSRADGPYAGIATVLDGLTAVAVTEAGVSESAGLGAAFPAYASELTWRNEQRRHGTNFAGAPLSSQATEGPRGALAAAMGQALAGLRATAFLSGPDLAAATDLLQVVAGRRLPLVSHLTLCALPGQAGTRGSGHEALHLAADSGCFILVAANVQEAVDFALIARHAAEQVLLPGLVSMDGEQSAQSLQDVRLPPAGLVRKFVAKPSDAIPTPTPAQQLLFGDTRRRVPRWHDPDHPVLLGAVQPQEAWGLGRAGGEVFFDSDLSNTIDLAFSEFADLTGRRHRSLSAHRLEDATLILVAQGAAVETAEAVADYLRDTQRMKVGVLGVRCLRPFPGAEAARLLGVGARVCVLERVDTPLAGDPPLLRELRAALDRALENGRFGGDHYPGYPALRESHQPQFLSVVYGLGGLPLRAADLAALCRDAETVRKPRVYLGMAFSLSSSPYPKRQVLLDRLRRSYPEISGLGLCAEGPEPDLRPEGAVSLALYRVSGGAGEALTSEIAQLLQRLLGGGLRCRAGDVSAAWGDVCASRIYTGTGLLKDPGDVPPVDLALLAVDPSLPGAQIREDLAAGGALLVQSALPDDALWAHLTNGLRTTLRQTGAGLFRVPPPVSAAKSTSDYLLGALCGVLLETGRLDLPRRRLNGAREELLGVTADAQQRMEWFEAGLDATRKIDLAALPDVPAQLATDGGDEAPALVRRLGNVDDAYDSLPRFWDQVGVLYREGDTHELAPDPYLALGLVPPLSAGFRDLSRVRDSLPVFDPALCTGCGDCWSACPDNAVGATALTPTRLLNAAIEGAGADALRPVAAKLAAGIGALCRDPETRRPTFAELLDTAFDRIKAKLPFPEERKSAIARELEGVRAAVGCLSLAVTEPFFSEPESGEKGSGELLALALDPAACKGCGLCARACEAGALRAQRQDVQSLAQARQVRRAWEGLPDNQAATIQRLRRHPEVGALAATLLAAPAAHSMAGADGAEPGSGAKLMLRLALAVMEAHQAPRCGNYLQEVRDTRDRVAGLIRGLLADALPADDLEALSRGLDGIGAGQADLSTFIGQAEDAVGSSVDAPRLRRLVALARGLGDLAWCLAEGRQGIGRARAGTVLAEGPGAGWVAAFPHSPFSGPATVDSTGDGVQLAAGLLEGQLRQTVEGLVLMRKARLELEQPADSARQWDELDALSWRELEVEERALCPVLLLVGDAAVLAGRGLAQLAWLLGTDLPVKLVVLADLDLGLAASPASAARLSTTTDTSVNLGLLALSQRGAYVAQTSLGTSGHLIESLERAAEFAGGPALLHVHAPSPQRHGFAMDMTLERARAAITARVFPLFRYDPQGEGVFGSRLDLNGNPEPRMSWSADSVTGAPTPAHWALGEERFSELFQPLQGDAPDPVPLASYLALGDQERRKKTPFVERGSNGGEPQRLRVDDRLVSVCDERQQAWRMLQELAGLVTPFTDRVREEAEEAVAAERKVELEAQAADYEARIRGLQDTMREQTRQEMRARLMQLAGYGEPRSYDGRT